MSTVKKFVICKVYHLKLIKFKIFCYNVKFCFKTEFKIETFNFARKIY